MATKWFILCLGNGGRPLPITIDPPDDDNFCLFDSEEEAEACARQQPLCVARGYEIYEWPHLERKSR